jgi:hypothetical protein
MLGFRQAAWALRLWAFAWIVTGALCTISGFPEAEAKDFRIIRLIDGMNRPDLTCCTPFYIFHTPVIEGDRVAFLSRNGPPDGVWSANITTRALTKLVGLNTPVPGGTGNFTTFYIDADKRLTIGGGRVAFFGGDANGKLGLFVVSVSGGAITRIATTETIAPDGVVFTGLSSASLNDQYIAFQGSTSLHQLGIYRATVAGTGLVTVMDTDDRLDARTTSGTAVDYFNIFVRPVMLTASNLAFGASGLFDPVSGANATFRSGESTPIADNLTALAGRPDDSHVRINSHSSGIGTAEVAFLADQPNNGFSGIFRAGNPDTAPAYVTTNTFVPGTARKFSSFQGFGHDASGVAFTGLSNVTSGTEYSVNLVAATGQPVERIAASPEYYFPIVGDRSVSQGRVVFMENSNFADTVFVAVPDTPGDLLITGDLDANPRDDLVIYAGASGIRALLNGTTWTKLHAADPQQLAAGDFNGNGRDDLLGDFGAGGLWVRYDSGTWTKIHSTSPLDVAAGRLDGNATEEAVADFGAGGLWGRFNDSTWTKLHAGAPQGLSAGDLDGNGIDDLLVDFGSGGLWARYNNATWLKLHNASPDDFLTARLDNNAKKEAVVDFGASGLWARYNNATWTKLHAGEALDLAAGDLDGDGVEDLLVNFEASGLWARYSNATWAKLHNTSPSAIAAADLDNSGYAEAVADFGVGGIWARYNNATWVKLPAPPP